MPRIFQESLAHGLLLCGCVCVYPVDRAWKLYAQDVYAAAYGIARPNNLWSTPIYMFENQFHHKSFGFARSFALSCAHTFHIWKDALNAMGIYNQYSRHTTIALLCEKNNSIWLLCFVRASEHVMYAALVRTMALNRSKVKQQKYEKNTREMCTLIHFSYASCRLRVLYIRLASRNNIEKRKTKIADKIQQWWCSVA